jgi:Uma2 family endonuclease
VRLTIEDVLTRGRQLHLPTDEVMMRAAADPVAHPVRFPTAADLPHDDGVPMETPWHRENMNLLIDTIATRWRDREDFYAGGNMFIYFSDRQVFGADFRGPDFFVVAGGVELRKPRLSWIAWEEGGRLPDVIVELASGSTRQLDRTVKKQLYGSRFRTREYFIYDPELDRLEGWRLAANGEYESLAADAAGRLRCEALDCSFGTWDGPYLILTGRWLRMFEPDGQLCPTRHEFVSGQAGAEAARLKAEIAALRGTPPTSP